ncbi:ACT domain-containing protein [Actinophytocola sp. NPDC049390]|uniref:ACT domain-containing protein n=1 Tax=Actinophytocola sp. NPDC049390 TaxID=3363894 RepID=UPI0037B1076B
MKRLTVDIAPGDYTVCRLPAGSAPPRIEASGLVSVTSTPTEVSVVCPTEAAPDSEHSHPGWRLLTVRGPLEFDLTGVMAALAGELAAAGVSLFAVSTYDTDHVLVKATDLARAVKALSEAGHEVN